MPRKLKVKDHLGNEYESFREMCEAYNMLVETARARIRMGWSLSEVLTKDRGLTLKEQNALHAKERIGECRRMNCGEMARIIAYNNSMDITIRFDDGTVREHVMYGKFREGTVAKEKRICAKYDINWKEAYIGQRFLMACGLWIRVLDATDATHVTVMFEDIGQERVTTKRRIDDCTLSPLGLTLKSHRTHTFCGFSVKRMFITISGQRFYPVIDMETGIRHIYTAPTMVKLWKERQQAQMQENAAETD